MESLLSRSLMRSTLLYYYSILSPHLIVSSATSDYSMSSSWKVFTWHLGLQCHQVSLLTLHLLSLKAGGLSSRTTFPSSCMRYFLQVLIASLMVLSASWKLMAPSCYLLRTQTWTSNCLLDASSWMSSRFLNHNLLNTEFLFKVELLVVPPNLHHPPGIFSLSDNSNSKYKQKGLKSCHTLCLSHKHALPAGSVPLPSSAWNAISSRSFTPIA